MTTSTYRRSSSSAAPVSIAWTERGDGDFHPYSGASGQLTQRQRSVVDLPWTTLRHVHGTDVIRVERPGCGSGTAADAAITDCAGAVLSVWVGDCAPIVLIGVEREIAVVHAGWRGLAAGILDAAIEAFREPVEVGVLGPAIGACCYEFGAVDAQLVAVGVGAPIERITTRCSGRRLRLDIPAAVEVGLRARGIAFDRVGGCTGCDERWFSHRVRSERQRHAVAAWQPVR